MSNDLTEHRIGVAEGQIKSIIEAGKGNTTSITSMDERLKSQRERIDALDSWRTSTSRLIIGMAGTIIMLLAGWIFVLARGG